MFVSDDKECLVDNGGCDGLCSNTIGGFICSCHDGFVQNDTDPTQCIGKVCECVFTLFIVGMKYKVEYFIRGIIHNFRAE